MNENRLPLTNNRKKGLKLYNYSSVLYYQLCLSMQNLNKIILGDFQAIEVFFLLLIAEKIRYALMAPKCMVVLKISCSTDHWAIIFCYRLLLFMFNCRLLSFISFITWTSIPTGRRWLCHRIIT